MICPICEREFGEDGLIPVVFPDKTFRLCEFDYLKLRTFLDGSVVGSVINIAWGAGRIDWSSWFWLRDFLLKNDIHEVMEFGAGLSSELFIALGMKLTSCDLLREHIAVLKKHQGYKHVDFIAYGEDGSLPDIEALYPGKKWDFVFVDGPQERSKEVRLAMKLARKWIYLHDPNLGEQSFFPNESWIRDNGPEDKLFRKVIGQHHQQMIAVLRERFGDREITGVEIGTAYGCLTKAILREIPNVARLITIDPYRHDDKSEFEAHRPQSELEDCKEFAGKALVPYASRVERLIMGSDEAAEILKSQQFDFVWIDGDHTGAQVARDLEHYDPMVKPGGLIGGHDLRFFTPLTDIVMAKYGQKVNRGGDYTWWVYK
jgi:predicted O-methyltransferase YrrM